MRVMVDEVTWGQVFLSVLLFTLPVPFYEFSIYLSVMPFNISTLTKSHK